jgi:hypothetical protein
MYSVDRDEEAFGWYVLVEIGIDGGCAAGSDCVS